MAAKKVRTKKKAKKVTKKKVRKVKKAKKVARKKVAKEAKKKIAKKKAAKKPKKTAAKKAAKAEVIGKVTHYYDRIGVAVVMLKASMKLGDLIRLKHGTQTFTQKVASMQVNHQPLTIAKKGQEIGLKVDKVINEGTVLLPA